MKIKETYSFKRTLYKGLTVLVEILIAGAIVYVTENEAFIFIAPLLEALRNFAKNGIKK